MLTRFLIEFLKFTDDLINLGFKRDRLTNIWAYLTNSFCVTDGICTDFSKFDQVNSIFSGCHLAQGYFWTQSMLSVAHFVLTILRDLSRRI